VHWAEFVVVRTAQNRAVTGQSALDRFRHCRVAPDVVLVVEVSTPLENFRAALTFRSPPHVSLDSREARSV
jgi:hypothetical protein